MLKKSLAATGAVAAATLALAGSASAAKPDGVYFAKFNAEANECYWELASHWFSGMTHWNRDHNPSVVNELYREDCPGNPTDVDAGADRLP